MKKVLRLFIILLLIFITIGCVSNPVKNVDEIKIGIVETTGDKYKSSIQWYNENLEVVDVQKLKYASLGNTFVQPLYYEDEIYLIPEGIFKTRDTKKIISINKKSFNLTEYDVDNIALQSIAINNDFIYVNSNINYETFINQINRSSKETQETAYPDAYFSTIVAAMDKVFLIGAKEDNLTTSYIYVVDKELNDIDRIDISEYGNGIFKFLVDKDYLYLSVNHTLSNELVSLILKVNIDTHKLEVIDLGVNFPDTMVSYKEKIFIAHNDIVTQEGTVLSILDKATNTLETKNLNTDLAYMDVIDNFLVVADENKITLFDIDADFEFVKKVMINKKKDNYISTLIIID